MADLTKGPLIRTLFAFALPTFASNVLQSLNGSINAMWVGHLVGTTGLAATSNANVLMFLVFALTFGFGMAFTVLIGQTIGRRDIVGVRRLIGAGASFFLVAGLIASAAGWVCAPALLRLLATPPAAYPQALAYARISFLGVPASMLLLFLQFALRGTGDSITPLLFVIPGTLIDVGLNPVLILGLGPAPALGIAGSALAGIIASFVSVIALIVYIYARDLAIRLRGPEWRNLVPAPATILTILRRGAPMGLQMIVMTVASLAMTGLVNHEGIATIAAYGAVNQLWIYIQMPAMAVGVAVSTMVAQHIGAERSDRIDRIAAAGVAANFALTAIMLASVLIPDRVVFGLFLDDTAAIAAARHINLLASWSYMLAGVLMVLSAVPRANGATIAPLFIMIISLIPGRLGFAFAALPRLGADALWWSFPVGYAIALPLTLAYYRWGGWRRIRLLGEPSREEIDETIQTVIEPAARLHPAV